jgi:probable HAF family extracellular repeat protein
MFVAGPKILTAFRWTAAGGLEEIGGNMDAVSISRDGKTIVGSALDSQRMRNAAIWMGGKNWRVLGGVPGGVPGTGSGPIASLSQAFGVSADGSVIVGSATVASTRVHAFRWDSVNGMVDLGTMIRDEESYATGVSANGKAIVGWTGNPGVSVHVGDTRSGVVFVDGIARLLHSYGWAGTAYATNDVGSTIVGRYHPSDASSSTETSTTWRWSAWDGRLEDLGAVPLKPGVNSSEYTSQPYGLSDTGDVVVGVAGAFQRSAAIWTPATAMVSVADFLTANGVTSHKGWDLRLAVYVSPNGKTIAGTGFNPQMLAESWIVTLP